MTYVTLDGRQYRVSIAGDAAPVIERQHIAGSWWRKAEWKPLKTGAKRYAQVMEAYRKHTEQTS
jgi:hypothetical protein